MMSQKEKVTFSCSIKSPVLVPSPFYEAAEKFLLIPGQKNQNFRIQKSRVNNLLCWFRIRLFKEEVFIDQEKVCEHQVLQH